MQDDGPTRRRVAGQQVSQATIFIARPPRRFPGTWRSCLCRFRTWSRSLYRDTRSLVRRSAIRAALTAFTAAIALRSMHGTCTAGDRVAGQAEVLHSDLCRDAHLTRAAAQQFRQTGRRHRAGDPTSPAADFGAGDGGVHLIQRTNRAGDQHIAGRGVAVHLADKLVIVGQHRRHDTAGAVGWRSPPAAGGVLFVHRRANILIQSTTAIGSLLVVSRLTSMRRSAAARRGRAVCPAGRLRW